MLVSGVLESGSGISDKIPQIGGLREMGGLERDGRATRCGSSGERERRAKQTVGGDACPWQRGAPGDPGEKYQSGVDSPPWKREQATFQFRFNGGGVCAAQHRLLHTARRRIMRSCDASYLKADYFTIRISAAFIPVPCATAIGMPF